MVNHHHRHHHHHQQQQHMVCCMCGDVGFPDKLFSCKRCCVRFQHSYCSNYYSESSSNVRAEICDWCQSEGGSSNSGCRKQVPVSVDTRSEYSGERVLKQHQVAAISPKGRNPGGAPSPRQGTRRYKLLKDVMC